MNVFYLKRSKEELSLAMDLFDKMSNSSIKSMLAHLINSMDFIVDFLANRHSEMIYEYNESKEIIRKFLGNDFLETYFYIKNLSRKEIKVINNDSIKIVGKRTEQVNKDFFKSLISKTITFFNMVYEKTERGVIWT